MKISNLFSPAVNKEARGNFNKLTGLSKFGVVVLTALAGLVTIPVGGIGGIAVFQKLTGTLPRKQAKVNEVASQIIQPKTYTVPEKPVTRNVPLHSTDVDKAENDDKPSPINILEIEKTDQLNEKPGVKPTELTLGQSSEDRGTLNCGEKSLEYAAALRARSPVTSDKQPYKKIEDQLSYGNVELQVGGRPVHTTLALSNDGNSGNQCAQFFSQNIPIIFIRRMQEALAKSASDSINGDLVETVMRETMQEVENKWIEADIPKRSNTTTNMLFFFPDTEGKIKGAFYGTGDTRTIIIRGDEVLRVGQFAMNGENQGPSTSHFDLEPGDLVFCSSDGVWHNASPLEVRDFLKRELNQDDSLSRALHNLVNACTTPPARIDDLNPILLRIPE